MKIGRIYVLQNIKEYIFVQKISILMLLLISAVGIPVTLISPYFFQIFIDRVLAGGEKNLFWFVSTGLLLVYTVRFLLDGGALFFGNRLLNRFSLSLRTDMFEKYLKFPVSFFIKKEPGDWKMRIMDDVDRLGSFVKDQVVDYFFSIVMTCVSLGLCMRLDRMMCLYCLAVIPVVFFLNYIIGRGSGIVNEEIRDVTNNYYTWTHSSLQFWSEIKAQSAENAFLTRFKQYRTTLAKLGMRYIRYWAFREIFNDFKANYLTRVMVYIIGAFFVIKQRITIGELVLFAEYFALLFNALDTINQKNMELRMNSPYYTRIFETLKFPEESNSHKENIKITGTIAVQGLTFGYSAKENVIDNINFEVKTGEVLAVIGKSGCGKTTLVKLILGLCTPRNGIINYDGVRLDALNTAMLYRQIGVVMQDSFLFNMTIKENLYLACPDATDTDLERVCGQANILDFILSASNGFDTVIGERGVKLSGGQKQRLCIARALLKSPKLLVLDEATSALDHESEEKIANSIRDLSKEMTVILIAHKPETILRADRIMLIDDKRIADIGTRDELMTRNERYRKLVDGQEEALI